MLSDRSGTVAIEAALAFALFLVPLLLAMSDYAIVLQNEENLERALRGLIFYAYEGTANAADNNGLLTAAQDGFGPGSTSLTMVTPQVSYYCITPPGGSILNGSSATASTECPEGQQLATYLTVSLSTTVTLPIAIPSLTSPLPLSRTATIRVN